VNIFLPEFVLGLEVTIKIVEFFVAIQGRVCGLGITGNLKQQQSIRDSEKLVPKQFHARRHEKCIGGSKT
jgi:hypothetical protein